MRSALLPGGSASGRRQAGTVAPGGRDIRLLAQREPDVAGGDSAREGLVGRAAERTEDQVLGENPAIAFAELVFQGLAEFAQSHGVLIRVRLIRELRSVGAAVMVADLTHHHAGVELRHQLVRHGVGETIDSLDDGQTVADLAHDD